MKLTMKLLMHPHTRNRELLRSMLGKELIKPVSVFDPLSAKMAEESGARAIQLAGSVAANVVAGVPDLMLATVNEVADLCKRISRGRSLPLIVDADHGFGNAVSVQRCVEEMTASGVSAITIEDTHLPARFESTGDSIKGSAGGFELTSIDEHVLKLQSAVASKTDPSMLIIARTSAFTVGGVSELCKRLQAYATTGVDAVHFIGKPSQEELQKISLAASPLPLMVSGAQSVPDTDLLSHKVSIKLAGHAPFLASQHAAYQSIKGEEVPTISSADLSRLLEVDKYKTLQKKYLSIQNPAAGMK
eukprot:TRINITY_DN10301_c0_g1_i1.p1 TRINITY_DN10301_c0_g1~~TRINITY_DN10301_c0_g1_i1.p1  ORF type:complete len:303 (+),score=76.24 TRINITY_DN10301_c0_g1_i1:83-991(+)